MGTHTKSVWIASSLIIIIILGGILMFGTPKDTSPAAAPKVTGDVTLSEAGGSVTLANSEISFTVDTGSAVITSLRKKGGPNLLAGGGKGYYYLNYTVGSKRDSWSPGPGDMTYKLISSTKDKAEISLSINDPKKAPFAIDLRFVLTAGSSGIYYYEIYKYTDNMPDGAGIEQARYAVRADPSVFKFYAVDDERKGLLPPPQDVKKGVTLADATVKLPSGSVYTKYQAIQYEGDNYVYGLYGDKIGLSLIKPNNEFVGGGPAKKELTVHQTDTTPIVLWHAHSSHYGMAWVTPKKGWEKIYGPVYFYVHEGNGLDQLWADAKRRSEQERKLWPYAWMEEPLYAADARGTVTGTLAVADGTSPKDAWVILGAPEPDWQLQNQNYLYYTKADGKGKFTIGGVRPGTYTLYAVVVGAFGEYRQDGISVQARKTADLGKLEWTPASHGKRLWQIGVPDRSAAEFRHGDDYHHYGLWFDYPLEFPKDVNFYIGKSNERTDWNYFHPAIHTPGDAKQLKVPANQTLAPWRIYFQSKSQLSGEGTMTIAIAGSVDGSLKIELNGREIGNYSTLPGPASDASFYRSAISGIYRTVVVPFDASLIQSGENIVTLTQRKAASGAGIMYDAIRMEVAP